MTYIVIAYVAMAYVVMAYVGMAYIVMAWMKSHTSARSPSRVRSAMSGSARSTIIAAAEPSVRSQSEDPSSASSLDTWL